MAVAWAATLAGCATPQYDDQTDKLITQLQTDVDTGLVSLITLDHRIALLATKDDAASKKALADAMIKAAYDANAAYYAKLDVDLTGLETRIDAEPSRATPYLDRALSDLRQNLLAAPGSLQATHEQLGVLSEDYLRIAAKTVNAQIGALLTRELALKSASATVTSSSAPGTTAAKPATAPSNP
jgi:hypothetical protein